MVRSPLASLAVPLVVLVALAGCGGDDEGSSPTRDSSSVDDAPPASEDEPPADVPETEDSSEPVADAPVADACGLLDEAFLDETFADVQGTFGDPLDFNEPLQTSPTAFCSWTDAATGLSLQLTVEPSATAETDDHSGRAYNIDVEPVVEPQEGPGEKAVLLVDNAFADSGSDGLPYGYFFVEGDATVFVETVGLDIGADSLRVLADEADRRLTAG